MYIEPNTTIEIMRDVPLESEQLNQLYFDTKAKRDEYFNGKVVYTVPNTMYQRANSSSVKVQLPIGKLMQCNYMRFKNTSFENRYIYCFITDVDYISNEVTLIKYKIDYVQTLSFWSSNSTMFNFNECVIEREHTVTDGLYEHLLPEGINPQLRVSRITNQFLHIKIRLCVTYFYTGGEVRDYTSDIVALGFERRGVLGGDINAMFFKDYPIEDRTVSELQSIANTIISDIETLLTYGVSITYASYIISPTGPAPTEVEAYPFELDVTEPPLPLLAAEIKNNKLYVSEFHSFMFSTTNGNSIRYKPEFLVNPSGGTQKIFGQYVYQSGVTSTITLYLNYEWGTYVYSPNVIGTKFFGRANQGTALTLSLNATPNISTDSFAEWIGTEYNSLVTKSIGSIIADGVNSIAKVSASASNFNMSSFAQTSILAGGQQVASAIKTASAFQANIQQAASAEDSTKLSTGSIESAVTGRVGFIIYEMVPTFEAIKEIDNYFTMYGYRVNRMGKPTLNNRPEFTYVQTEKCTINESVPNSFKSAVEQIFNRGITFWKNPANVGNYSVDNSPAS